MDTPYSSLANSARTQEMKRAKGILWFVGVLTILVNGFFFMNASKEVDTAFDAELRKEGMSLEKVKTLPPEVRADIEKVHAETLGKVRLIYGAPIGLGFIFIVCALMVDKKPLAATVTGLVLYLGSTAAFAAIDPASIAKGIIIKIFIIIALVSAVKAALAIEKDRKSQPIA